MSLLKDVGRLNIAPITRKLELKNYNPDDPSLAHEFFYVWVNLPKSMHDKWNDIQINIMVTKDMRERLQKEYIGAIAKYGEKSKETKEVRNKIDDNIKKEEKTNEEMMSWYSEVWSRHPDESTHWNADEVNHFAHQLMIIDKSLWAWITNQTQSLIVAHVNPQLKN